MSTKKPTNEQRETTSFDVENGSEKQIDLVCKNCKSDDNVRLHGSYQPVYFCARCREEYPGAGDFILM